MNEWGGVLMWHFKLEGSHLRACRTVCCFSKFVCDEAWSNRKIKPTCVANEGCQGRHLTTKLNRLI